MVESRRKILFPNVTDEEWNDWHWQVKNRIETLEDLKKYIELTPEEEEGVKACLGTLRMAITPLLPVPDSARRSPRSRPAAGHPHRQGAASGRLRPAGPPARG